MSTPPEPTSPSQEMTPEAIQAQLQEVINILRPLPRDQQVGWCWYLLENLDDEQFLRTVRDAIDSRLQAAMW
jgi:hypothetical protein